MKTNATFIASALVSLSSLSVKAQIPNPGFETWTNATVITTFEEPKGWGTDNTSQDLLGDFMTVTKSTSAHFGSYAMKLESSSTSFVEAVAGANPIVYNLGDGFPYSFRPANLDFYYKFTYEGYNTANVLVLFTANNIPIL